MGQGQSSAENETAQQGDTAVKQDYYDLLSVERTASEDEIKKAYRRKALELHPDRNYGNVEDATRLFAEVQSAYEVLSDPQERAWYDSHRDVLLRGGTVSGQSGEEYSYNVKMTTADEVLKLMMRFNGKLDFSDAPGGFYGGLDDFFKKLGKEEDIACQWEDEDAPEYPEFGSKDDDYDDVVRPFYQAWTGFATRKSYAWKDHYRLSDAPDRRIRRLMEKENNKFREEAKQELNEAVRVLVAFVRKRDPRVKNNQVSEAERQKALKEAAAAQAARSRAARQAKIEELENFVVPEWAQSRAKDEHEGEFSSESDREEHEYDCVVCDKTFKSEAQLEAHEKSKKHIKLLKQLKRDMRAEGQGLDLEEVSSANGLKPVNSAVPQEPSEDDLQNHDNDPLITGSENEASGANIPQKAPSPSPKSSPQPAFPISDNNTDNHDSPSESSDYAPRSTVESRLESTTLTSPATSDNESKPKLGKAKLKRAKKAAAASANASGADSTSAADAQHRCGTCAAVFPSKNKLFTHIKETKGHALLVSQTKGGSVAGGGGKGRGKKR